VNPDLKQAILECLTWYYDQIYDGGIEPFWVDQMIERYCADDGITDFRDALDHFENEMGKYRQEMKGHKEAKE